MKYEQYKLPKGFTILHVLSASYIGSGVLVIAKKSKNIYLCSFDGISEHPTSIFQYEEIQPPKESLPE